MQKRIKIVIIGEAGVGKTTFLTMRKNSVYDAHTTPTIGVDFYLEKREGMRDICYWDCSGAERFRPIVSSYFRNADGAIILFDLSNPNHYYQVNDWYQCFLTYIESSGSDNNQQPYLVVIGNKADKDYYTQETAEVRNFCKNNQIPYYEVSSRNEKAVNWIFDKISNELQGVNTEEEDTETFQLGTEAIVQNCCSIL